MEGLVAENIESKQGAAGIAVVGKINDKNRQTLDLKVTGGRFYNLTADNSTVFSIFGSNIKVAFTDLKVEGASSEKDDAVGSVTLTGPESSFYLSMSELRSNTAKGSATLTICSAFVSIKDSKFINNVGSKQTHGLRLLPSLEKVPT